MTSIDLQPKITITVENNTVENNDAGHIKRVRITNREPALNPADDTKVLDDARYLVIQCLAARSPSLLGYCRENFGAQQITYKDGSIILDMPSICRTTEADFFERIER